MLFGVGDGLIDQLGVLGQFGCGQDQRRIGGRVGRLVLAQQFKVTRVGNDDGVCFQLLQSIGHGWSRTRDDCAGWPSGWVGGWLFGVDGQERMERRNETIWLGWRLIYLMEKQFTSECNGEETTWNCGQGRKCVDWTKWPVQSVTWNWTRRKSKTCKNGRVVGGANRKMGRDYQHHHNQPEIWFGWARRRKKRRAGRRLFRRANDRVQARDDRQISNRWLSHLLGCSRQTVDKHTHTRICTRKVNRFWLSWRPVRRTKPYKTTITHAIYCFDYDDRGTAEFTFLRESWPKSCFQSEQCNQEKSN